MTIIQQPSFACHPNISVICNSVNKQNIYICSYVLMSVKYSCMQVVEMQHFIPQSLCIDGSVKAYTN